MERCPVCRARLKGEWLCPRCGSDLSLLLRIEKRVQLLVQNAVIRIAKGEVEQAEQVLGSALMLKTSPLVRVLMRLVRENRQ